MRITIENPHNLVDMFKSIAPEWVVKYRGVNINARDRYTFGIQNDPTKVWDRFRLHIDRETSKMYDASDFHLHHFVKLTFHYMGTSVEITNTIKLEELRNLQSVCEHILDGINELIDNG